VQTGPIAPEVLATVEPKSRGQNITRAEERSLEIRAAEDQLFEKHYGVTEDAAHWGDIVFGQKEPPAEWVAEVGKRRAERRLRIANSAWMSAKDAPVGLLLSQRVVSSIVKARSTEKNAPRTLNVAVVQMPEAPQYPTITVKQAK